MHTAVIVGTIVFCAVAFIPPVLALAYMAWSEVDWIKLFGGPSRAERSYRRGLKAAHSQISQLFADAAAQMAEAASRVNPFKLGGWGS